MGRQNRAETREPTGVYRSDRGAAAAIQPTVNPDGVCACDCKGKNALVTGSSKGIGRAIATRLGREGANVIVNYNSDPKGAEEAVQEIRAFGVRAEALKADLGSVPSVHGAAGRRGPRRSARWTSW